MPEAKKKRKKQENKVRERKFDPEARPIWEEIVEIANTIPKEELSKLPKDLAENFEFYMYGRKP